MKIALPRFGIDEMEIDPASLINFPNGLPGFEDCNQFKLFHSEDNPEIFWLLSIDDPSVVFSIASPEVLGLCYNISLTDEEMATLQAQENDELLVAVIYSWQDEQQAIEAYLESPVIINVSRQTALQKILLASDTSTAEGRDNVSEASEDTLAGAPHLAASQTHSGEFVTA